MAGLRTPLILKFLGLLILSNCAVVLPKGVSYPNEESLLGNAESIAYSLSVNDKPQQDALLLPDQIDRPKNCFHFFVSRNMSSLLADATKMLRQVRDRREREWLLTFIYRIKSLAEHLRSHPEARNYDCLPSGEESKKKQVIFSDKMRVSQPELYFVDDIPSQNQKRSVISQKLEEEGDSDSSTEDTRTSDTVVPKLNEDNQEIHQQEHHLHKEQSPPSIPPKGAEDSKVLQEYTPVSEPNSGSHQGDQTVNNAVKSTLLEDTESKKNHLSLDSDDTAKGSEQLNEYNPFENGIILSSADCELAAECAKKDFRNYQMRFPPGEDDVLVRSLPSGEYTSKFQDERYRHEILKERIRNALLEEMAPEVKKLRTVGGSKEDLINLWNLSEGYEDKTPESYQDGYFDYEENGAAAGDLNSHDRGPPNYRTVAPSMREVKKSKRHYQQSQESNDEPYDDSDALVQQLYEVRANEPPSKSTKSLDDQNEEYLITSTHIPY